MHQFCPLCNKKGFRRRIKALQVNLHEAVWTCEGDECEWPFGYEDFIYFSREVGNTWSCYWDDFKPPLRAVNECVPVSTELALYTPPETPAEPVIKDCPTDVLCFDNNVPANNVNNSIIANEVEVTNIVDISDHDAYCLTNNTPVQNNSKIGNFSTNDKDNLCITDAEGIHNIDNISKDVLTGTEELKLEKTFFIAADNTFISRNDLETDANKVQLAIKNEDILAIKNEDILAIKNEDILAIKNADQNQDTGTVSLQKESSNLIGKGTISNVKVTTVKLDGLPPVSLSYEVPTSLSTPKTVSNESRNPSITYCVTIPQPSDTSVSTTQFNGTHKLLTLINKQSNVQSVPVGRRYAKFSFSAIKKKIQATNNDDSLKSDDKCLSNSNKGASNNIDTDQIQKQDSSKTITSGSCIDTNNCINTEISKPEPTTSSNATTDSNLNLHTLLDDYIKDETLYGQANTHYTLPDIDEDWINSLLH